MALPAGIPFQGLAIDDFRSSLGASSFLLTHMHSDHLRGLKDGWCGGKLYCSPVTRELLLHRFKISPKLVETIDIGETRMIRLECPSHMGEIIVDVTALDANHCPGSTMFRIRGKQLSLSPLQYRDGMA